MELLLYNKITPNNCGVKQDSAWVEFKKGFSEKSLVGIILN
jgi:hypothetical protein